MTPHAARSNCACPITENFVRLCRSRLGPRVKNKRIAFAARHATPLARVFRPVWVCVSSETATTLQKQIPFVFLCSGFLP